MLPRNPHIRFSSLALLVSLVVLVSLSFFSLPLQFSQLFSAEAARASGEFLLGFFPPDTSSVFLQRVLHASAETLSMSALGTLIAVVLALLLALPASGRLGGGVRATARGVLNVLRAIPELIWASVLLIAAGLGPFAGTLALAAHTTGVLGRLFADAIENSEPLPERTLHINGVAPFAAFIYATLPQCLPQMMSYTLYRWENNIRAAAILGVVGAGGLGQMLKFHLSLFQMQQAASVILAILILVLLVDVLSFTWRQWMTRG